MRTKKITRRIVTAALVVGMTFGLLTGCGGSGTDETGADTESSMTEAEAGTTDADSGQTASGDTSGQDASNPASSGKTTDSPADALTGDWEFMCSIYHSEDSEGGPYEYVTMCTDEYSPDSKVSIRREGDKFLVDYRYLQMEFSEKVYGAELKYRDREPYKDAESSWYMEMTDVFEDEDEDYIERRFTLEDDDTLVVSKEYFGDPDDEYSYYSLEKDLYLRKGSPRFDDPEALRYFDTVTVSGSMDLLNSIQNNRKVILEGGRYDLSGIGSNDVNNDKIEDYFDAVQISNVSNFCLEAAEGEDVEIVIDDPYSPVLNFSNGSNITVRGITAGHDVEPGYCSGSVLNFDSVDGVNVDNCKLYGCGTYGIETSYSYNINVSDTEIYECTYGLISLNVGSSAVFTGCTMRDSGDLSLIYVNGLYDVTFEDCTFSNNVANAFEESYFVSMGEYDSVTFRNCAFNNNQFSTFSNREVTLENCTSDNNQAGFKELLDSSDASQPLSRDDILANYDSALAKQKEIDDKLDSDALLDQLTLNQMAYQEYELWDVLLNQIWAYLGENLDESQMEALTAEQKQWIKEKEASMKEAGAGFEGGSMQPMVEYGSGATTTQKRVEDLLGKYVKQ